MWAAIWGSFQSAFICGALDSVLPLFVLHTYGWSSMQAGGSFVALMGPSMISPMIGKLVPRLGARVSAVWGYLGSAVTLGCLALVSRDTDAHKTLFVIFLILCGCSMVFFEIAAWVDAVTAAQTKTENQPHYFTPGGAIAQVYGLTNVMFALGFVAGPLGAGLMYRRFGWTATVLLLASITFASAIPTILWLDRKSEVVGLPTTLPVGSVVEVKESL
ncbi:MFS general substrate transporter [Aspergillus homomorphus CBS 101889]|uniref:MFS general substrate transporter n=1 Tax=Aspergillus homomorphus (strain CBS 101889) TaxID=1450537 RepID=A0A395HG39_ASPHC|nr:MFS general substrate transporter [Aspergillus homomorphus CBS 101889]RAL06469.1 MFS general substrate transporter [Aspergillus homomorphus CBS 101889]